ncbi:MAG: AraC family transcriptional regulator [Firmicutes bacterium]|nr:AraC family transcriptional regulator [Bacillota bacterium]
MEITNHSDCFNFKHAADTPTDGSFAKHMHSDYEILLFIEGDVEYFIEGSFYKLRPYDILLIKPIQYHFVKILSPKPYDRFVFSFKNDSCSKPLLNEVFSKNDIYNFGENSFVETAMRKIEYFTNNLDEKYTGLMLENMLNDMLLMFTCVAETHEQQSIHNPRPSLLIEINEYINNNLTSDLSIPVIAKRYHLSPTYLSHFFKKQMRISIMKYVHSKRLLLSHELMKKGEKPMKTYTKCGFQDYPSFYKAYKKFFGYTPSDTQIEKTDFGESFDEIRLG